MASGGPTTWGDGAQERMEESLDTYSVNATWGWERRRMRWLTNKCEALRKLILKSSPSKATETLATPSC
eukprot:2347290-Pyramimonas_sp.AAC.1